MYRLQNTSKAEQNHQNTPCIQAELALYIRYILVTRQKHNTELIFKPQSTYFEAQRPNECTRLVRLQVFLHIRLLRKSATTHDALKRLFASVGTNVLLHVEVFRKRLVAVFAFNCVVRGVRCRSSCSGR